MGRQFVIDCGSRSIKLHEALSGAGGLYLSRRAAGRIARARYDALADAIKTVLARAIEQGGTTLRDYAQSDGNPGYFAVKLNVYERAGKPCKRCGAPIRSEVIGQRSSYFCPTCQR